MLHVAAGLDKEVICKPNSALLTQINSSTRPEPRDASVQYAYGEVEQWEFQPFHCEITPRRHE